MRFTNTALGPGPGTAALELSALSQPGTLMKGKQGEPEDITLNGQMHILCGSTSTKSLRVVAVREQESRPVVVRGRGGEGRRCCVSWFNGSRVSGLEDEKDLETLVMTAQQCERWVRVPQNHTLKNGGNGNFHIMYILPQ